MIKTDEIRTGNWLSTHENSWGTVKYIGKTIMLQHALGTHGYFPEQLSPIEITLDILSLCGFQPYNAGYRHKDTHLFLRYYGIGNVTIEIANEIGECEFVHHLQNLYFDITGRLLEPNLFGN